MLWQASNATEARRKEGERRVQTIGHSNQTMRQAIAQMRAEIEQRKRENVELMAGMTARLFVATGEYCAEGVSEAN